jgi:hypothetical protein
VVLNKMIGEYESKQPSTEYTSRYEVVIVTTYKYLLGDDLVLLRESGEREEKHVEVYINRSQHTCYNCKI